MLRTELPIGVVLAGGRGTRMGGTKLTVALGGRPLISYPLAALQAVLHEVAVIAKRDVELPSLTGVVVWIEPDEPRHPLVGIVESLGLAGGRAVLSCPADLPFVSVATIRCLAQAPSHGAPAVIVATAGGTQPLLGRYEPAAAELLAPAARSGTAAVRDAVGAIGPKLIEIEDERELFNVNTPADLVQASAMLAYPKVKS